MRISSETFAENEPLGPSLSGSSSPSASLSLPDSLSSFRFPKLCASIPSVIFGNLAFLLIGGTRFVAHENGTERSCVFFVSSLYIPRLPLPPLHPFDSSNGFFYGVFRRSREFQQHPLPLSPTITTVASAGCNAARISESMSS